jgi:hypothetical protein
VGPSLVNVVGESLIGFDLVALMGIVHSIFGVAAVILGIWLVGWLVEVWAYVQSSETRYCAGKILVLWLLAL